MIRLVSSVDHFLHVTFRQYPNILQRTFAPIQKFQGGIIGASSAAWKSAAESLSSDGAFLTSLSTKLCAERFCDVVCFNHVFISLGWSCGDLTTEQRKEKKKKSATDRRRILSEVVQKYMACEVLLPQCRVSL